MASSYYCEGESMIVVMPGLFILFLTLLIIDLNSNIAVMAKTSHNSDNNCIQANFTTVTHKIRNPVMFRLFHKQMKNSQTNETNEILKMKTLQ